MKLFIIKFLKERQHLIMPIMIIVMIVSTIMSLMISYYIYFRVISPLLIWGFEPIVWWKAISAFVINVFIGTFLLLILLLIQYTPLSILFEVVLYHEKEYLKSIHTPTSYFYLFLSHKSEDKEKVVKLKNELEAYGIKCFVAHENIEATKEWDDEIIQALRSMDMLVALMIEKFKESDWTSQEIGFALGKNVPVISVNLGTAPYGFISRKQAINGSWDNLAQQIIDILFKKFMYLEKVVDVYILQMSKCKSFKEGDILEDYISYAKNLTKKQINNIIDTYNKNSQLFERYKFRDNLNNNKFIDQFNKILKKRKYIINHKTFKIEQIS